MNLVHAFFVFASFVLYQSFFNSRDKSSDVLLPTVDAVKPCHSPERKALRQALQELWATKDVRKQMIETQRLLATAKRQLALADSEKGALNQQLTLAQKQLAKTKKLMIGTALADKAVSVLKKDLTAAQAELATTEDTANTLNQQLTEAQAELAYQENAADALKQQLTEAQAELATKDATADELKQQLTEAQAELATKHATADALKQQLTKAQAELTQWRKRRPTFRVEGSNWIIY